MRSARPVGFDATQPGGDPISDSGAECGAGKEASGGDTLIRCVYRVIVLDASVRPCPQVQQIEAELVREEKLLSKKQVPDMGEMAHSCSVEA